MSQGYSTASSGTLARVNLPPETKQDTTDLQARGAAPLLTVLGAIAKMRLTLTCSGRHRKSGPQGSIVPDTLINDPAAWTVAELSACKDEWIYHLTEQDVEELDEAIASVEARGLDIMVR